MSEYTEYEMLLKDEQSLLQEIGELQAILEDATSDLKDVRERLVIHNLK